MQSLGTAQPFCCCLLLLLPSHLSRALGSTASGSSLHRLRQRGRCSRGVSEDVCNLLGRLPMQLAEWQSPQCRAGPSSGQGNAPFDTPFVEPRKQHSPVQLIRSSQAHLKLSLSPVLKQTMTSSTALTGPAQTPGQRTPCPSPGAPAFRLKQRLARGLLWARERLVRGLLGACKGCGAQHWGGLDGSGAHRAHPVCACHALASAACALALPRWLYLNHWEH